MHAGFIPCEGEEDSGKREVIEQVHDIRDRYRRRLDYLTLDAIMLQAQAAAYLELASQESSVLGEPFGLHKAEVSALGLWEDFREDPNELGEEFELLNDALERYLEHS